MIDPCLEQAAAAVQMLGTVVTIAGLMVVAPHAMGAIGRTVWSALVKLVRSFRKASTPPPVPVNRGALFATLPGVSIARGGSSRLYADGSVEDRLKALLSEIERLSATVVGLESRLEKLAGEMREGLAASEVRVAEVRDEAKHGIEALAEKYEKEKRHQERLNTFGFPVAAFGALLAGTPSIWLLSWAVIGTYLGLGVTALVIAVVSAIRWRRQEDAAG